MENQRQMIPVWFWVGLMLLVYGILITGAGLLYISSPPPNYVAKWTNPNLWWGGVMVVVGVIFLYLGRKKNTSN